METPGHTPKHNDLIFDVGMHTGEDSEFYLRKGFRVVAFEAIPDLIASCKSRLREFLDSGQLVIVEGAIVEPDLIAAGQKTVKFYQNSGKSDWGTVSADWAERNERMGKSSKVIEVAAIDFTEAIRRHGIPYYMKIDIEGCDTVCIQALRGFEERPSYISLESDKTSLENVEQEIDLFQELGYDSFQAVEQSQIQQVQSPPDPPREGKPLSYRFDRHSSGLFGLELSGKWKSRPEVVTQYRRIFVGYRLLGEDGVMSGWTFPGARQLRGLMRRVVRLLTHATVPGWYDTHARHSSVQSSGAAR
jgi:FkbM family methyltransferase